MVGIVPQDTILFNDTIAYNIAYGREGAKPARTRDCSRAAASMRKCGGCNSSSAN
ncbi:hypothetical protein GCM10027081_53200 [Cupriavidus yeoncheonensis]